VVNALPAPGEAFRWINVAGVPALICPPLSQVADHLFTTRRWRLGTSPADDESWAEVAGAIGVDRSRLIRVNQVHGAAVFVARDAGAGRSAADVLVTRAPDLAIAVQAADCVPLLLADRRTGAVAAVHAGWRGLAARAPLAAVSALESESPNDLLAAVGPAIGACCYEVGLDVRECFLQAGFAAGEIAAWFLRAPRPSARNASMAPARATVRPDRWFFDPWMAARGQLIAAGVPAGQVFVAELCTASHPAAFCSYRRDGSRAGRIAGAIRSGPPRP
jgi:YfiH family protein